jgi:hypothetical protein
MSFESQATIDQDQDKAAALAQAAIVVANPPIATQNLFKPVSKGQIDTEAANKKADGNNGKAVATMLVKELLKQEIKLVLFLRNIADLGQEGRTQFRVVLKEKQGKLKELLAFHEKDSYQYVLVKQAHATATVRMSEIKVFSEACDIGFTFDESETYPAIIAAARMWKQGQASDEINADGNLEMKGPTRRRGRPATPFADKFKKFLADNVTADNHAEAREFFNTWMALQNFGKEVKE